MKIKSSIFFKSGITLVVSLLFFSPISSQMKEGRWKGFLKLNDSTQLPFTFEVWKDSKKYSFTFQNAEESINTTEINIRKDSVFVKMPVFDSEFKILSFGEEMTGIWINYARKDKNIIPFSAYYSPIHEPSQLLRQQDYSYGKWEVTFSPRSKDSTKAIGLFTARSTHTEGTFLTETGDYRFLEGQFQGDTFHLACFDGSHAFYFRGQLKGNKILNGHFYSGAHWHETWVAVKNEKFELKNPDSLTYLKPGFTKVDFNFKNLDGKNVSLQDEKFKNKVVIIQIMGTWCPNCMDETKFLAPFYNKYNSKGLEVVALAFERTDDFKKAVNNIQRSKTRFGAKYEFLITMKTGKNQASEALPMLNAVMAFPTTIYIDKKGVVRKIYTGFNGPATGDAHTKFVE